MNIQVWINLSMLKISRYSISSEGRLRNYTTLKLLGLNPNTAGYHRVSLCNDNGSRTNAAIHLPVANAFVPGPDNKPTVDHINRDRSDNKVENLRWHTQSEQNSNRSSYTQSGRSVY